jgi:hypothetical protein
VEHTEEPKIGSSNFGANFFAIFCNFLQFFAIFCNFLQFFCNFLRIFFFLLFKKVTNPDEKTAHGSRKTVERIFSCLPARLGENSPFGKNYTKPIETGTNFGHFLVTSSMDNLQRCIIRSEDFF